MLGDIGIPVHPQDERFQNLGGNSVIHPFILNRRLPIIADEYVDTEFDTGAVKITPVHDLSDYNLGKKHNLEFINIITDNRLLNVNAGPNFDGKKCFDAPDTESPRNVRFLYELEPNLQSQPKTLPDNKLNDHAEPADDQWPNDRNHREHLDRFGDAGYCHFSDPSISEGKKRKEKGGKKKHTSKIPPWTRRTSQIALSIKPMMS